MSQGLMHNSYKQMQQIAFFFFFLPSLSLSLKEYLLICLRH